MFLFNMLVESTYWFVSLVQVVYMPRRGDQVEVCGGGKPVKVSLFNEVMSLHQVGVGGIVH